MGGPWDMKEGVDQAPLFPLVDILFSAAGVFLILIAVTQMLKARIQLPPRGPDAIIVLAQKDLYQLFTREDPTPRVLHRFELSRALDDILSQRDRILSLLIAFDANTFYERNLLNKLLKGLRQKNDEPPSDRQKSGIEIMWRPMADPEDLPPVLLEWQSRARGRADDAK